MNQIDQAKAQFIQAKLNAPSRESRFGFHVIQLFNANKYEFYLRYVKGWDLDQKKSQLHFGGIIHDVREFFYLTMKQAQAENQPTFDLPADELCDVFGQLMAHARNEYDPSAYVDDLRRGIQMLRAWHEVAIQDFKNYSIVEVEYQLDVKLPNGFPVTVKLDDLRQSRTTGTWLIGEAKTTGWSIDKMAQSVFEKDQRTQYSMAVQIAHPDRNPLSVMPDIMYAKGSQARAGRPAIFTSSPQEIALYTLQLIGLIDDLYDRLTKLEGGMHPAILFPRNGDMSSLFGSPYSVIPREVGYDPDELDPPEGFALDPRVKSGLINDFIQLYKEVTKNEK